MKDKGNSKRVWNMIDEGSPLDNGTSERMWDGVENKLDRYRGRRNARRLMLLAILPLLGVVLLYKMEIMKTSQKEALYSTQSTVDTVNLSDGSLIILQPYSKIAVSADFGKEVRKISMQGSGYFDIAKDSQRPFMVDAGDFIVEVLGTRFDLTKSEHEQGVKLYKGKVKIKKGGKETVLLPGEAWAYSEDRSGEHYFLPTAKREFSFERTELRAVMQKLESAYHASINYPTDLGEKSVSGTFEGGLEEILTIIAFPFDLKVNKINETTYNLK